MIIGKTGGVKLRAEPIAHIEEKIEMNLKRSFFLLIAAFFASSILYGADESKEPQPGESRTVKIAGVDVAFRWIPAGEFTMGSPDEENGRENDEQAHRVVITRGYWLAETETTQGLWRAVMGENPRQSDSIGDNFPVDSVSWRDCQNFISQIQRYAPKGMKFRLPTEAHWEYACRAGSETAYSWGNEWNSNNANGFVRTTKSVGYYGYANAWGLTDMHGNVWEWCSDWYGAYPTDGATDPEGPSEGTKKVIRGGSWSFGAWFCRSARRFKLSPEFSDYYRGFRLELADAF